MKCNATQDLDMFGPATGVGHLLIYIGSLCMCQPRILKSSRAGAAETQVSVVKVDLCNYAICFMKCTLYAIANVRFPPIRHGGMITCSPPQS
jgi:hypothetical protein